MSAPASSAFISYSREDSEFALRLAQDLKAAGASVWLDQLDIKLGHSWDNAIEDALTEAPLMLIVLSPSSARSDNVRNEISFALEQGKIVIPVLYMDCVVPLRLQRTQRIDFRADYARGLGAVLRHLGVTQPDPLVLQRAAEGDAQRHAAWQAREAEAARLRETQRNAEQEATERKDDRFQPHSQLGQSDAPREPIKSLRQHIGTRAPLVLLAITGVVLAFTLFLHRSKPSPQGNTAINAEHTGTSDVHSENHPVISQPSSPAATKRALLPNQEMTPTNPLKGPQSTSILRKQPEEASGNTQMSHGKVDAKSPYDHGLRHFYWLYTFDPVGHQRRDWYQESATRWNEIYEDGRHNYSQVVDDHYNEGGNQGIVCVGGGATLRLFIPNPGEHGTNPNWLKTQQPGASNWTYFAPFVEVTSPNTRP